MSTAALFGVAMILESRAAMALKISDPLDTAHPYNQPTDKLNIGGAELEDVWLEYVDLQTSHVNTIGLGPRNTSLPNRMADQGLIKSPSFSIWSNITENGHGGLLFGGVNSAKYRGPLQAYPLGEDQGVSIPLEKLQVRLDSDAAKEYTLSSKPCLLDSIQTSTYLPNDTVQQIYNDYNISWIGFKGSEPEFGTLNCDRKNAENHTVSLVFGDAVISAPWSDLIKPWITPDVCLFNIQPSSEGFFDHDLYGGQIGTIFTHRMYIAVNYKGRSVGVAAMNQHPGPDDIVEIEDGSKLPDAVEHFSSSAPSHTGGSSAVTISTSSGLAATHTIPAVHKPGPFTGIVVMIILVVL